MTRTSDSLLKQDHLLVEAYTDANWATSKIDKRFTTGYCTMVGGNLASWKSKKQHDVSKSSAEAEYRTMALGTCELLWPKILPYELSFMYKDSMALQSDCDSARLIITNLVLPECTKHFEVDVHFVREKVESKVIRGHNNVHTSDQLADSLTKVILRGTISQSLSKLGTVDIYAPD